jgi:hypothetical protein
MAMLGLSPSLSVAAEDIRHFKVWAHDSRPLFRVQLLQWADYLA